MIKTDKVIYHTKTQEEYDWLMAHLVNENCLWAVGIFPKSLDVFSIYESQTCIRVTKKVIDYSCLDFYKNEDGYSEYEFIEVSDIMENKEKEKGNIMTDSENKVYNSDVMEFIPQLDDNSIDLAIVDPPYNLHKCDWDKFVSEQTYFDFTFKWIDLLLPKISSTGSLYLFNTAYNSAVILNYLRDKEIEFKNWITWYKKDGLSVAKRKYVNTQETILFFTKSNSHTFNYDDIRVPYTYPTRKKGILKNGKRWFPNEKGKLCNDVWEITSQRHKQKINGKTQKPKHPTIKPHDMIERIILASSNENDIVLDLFSGSGTTSIISKKLNRRFIGCEKEKEYIELIKNEGIEIGLL